MRIASVHVSVWAAGLALAIAGELHAAVVTLKHISQFEAFAPPADHLMGVEVIAGHYGVISAYKSLKLVDLNLLPPDGTHAVISELKDLDASNTVTLNDEYIYVNIRMGGIAVVRFDALGPSLFLIRELEEAGVFFEKMSIVGNRLYVPAHAYGIRIYDLTDPADPQLIGSLATGFDDAFSIAVEGNTAYVADGAGGLKIVDIADETAPCLIDGENVESTAGTAEDVLFTQGRVYVACGGAGVAIYDPEDLGNRVLHDTPVCAKQLVRVGDYLGVADLGGVEIFEIGSDGSLTYAARERGSCRKDGYRPYGYRAWHGVEDWGDNRVVAANWDFVDVYELVDLSTGDQPDLSASTQRIYFPTGGGSTQVILTNSGAGHLSITSVSSSLPNFMVAPTSLELEPGESQGLTIEYLGGMGAGHIELECNDPDENPFPIEVLGQTEYLDMGEPAIPFTLESWTLDHATGEIHYGTFDLDVYSGKVIFLQCWMMR